MAILPARISGCVVSAMSDADEREMLHFTEEEARVLYRLATDAISDSDAHSKTRLASICGRLLAVVGDEWLAERHDIEWPEERHNE